jgi:UDP-2-acetamido-3-amino-2,3-dideoxy-glucuronate N-acetyltransferase
VGPNTLALRAFVHPKAHVDDSVQLGAGTKVWQFASVTRGAILGADCSVSPGAMLDGSRYGDRVVISGGVTCGAGFLVGDDVFLGPNVCLANDMWPSADKDGYDDEALRDGSHWAVIVESGVSIGANAVILPSVRIGLGSKIAAGAVVDRSVPPGSLWRRCGEIVPLPEDTASKRMRWAC